MHHHARRDSYLISTDPALYDVDAIHRLIANTPWARGMPRTTLVKALANGINFPIYKVTPNPPRGELLTTIGVARVVTDRATYAYLTDVIIEESARGEGLARWLMEVILSHPDLQGLRRFALLTRDAHGLYAKFGFKNLEDPKRYMEVHDPHVYVRPETLREE